MIYLDHNASAPLRDAVRSAMARHLEAAPCGNPSSAHAWGRQARGAVEQARRHVATAVGVDTSRVFFTSGGTESNNLALFGLISEPQAAHLIVSPIEHSSVLGPVKELERCGARVTWLPVDAAGRVDASDVEESIEPTTTIVSVGWANNEIGTIQPMREISEVCRRHRVLLHSDAVQALGKMSLDADSVDLCSLSAHKVGGPIGAGAICVRSGIQLSPLWFGGGQERGLRPGSENVASLVGFGVAAATLADCRLTGAELRERLWGQIQVLGGLRRNSPTKDCLDSTLNVTMNGVRGEAVVAALDLEGVAVSVGSACAVGSGEPSHVLMALGRSESEARDGVRFSLGPETTRDEVDAAAAALVRVVARIRNVSIPFSATG